jgi:hypothetical protein
MKRYLFDLFAALLFGAGLAISGMTMPEKIIGFLDIFGNWDPTLLMVMVGAIAVHTIGYRLVTHRATPLFSSEFSIPQSKQVTVRLVVGSAIFGFGWGLAGFCPGPALVATLSGQGTVLLFVISMIVGIWLFRLFEKMRVRG